MRHGGPIVVVMLAVLTRNASAYETQVDPSRYYQEVCGAASFDMHWDGVPIPVYINNSPSDGVQLLKKVGGAYWTTSDVARELQIAIADFNDSVGIPIRLYYNGVTGSPQVSGGIVIQSSPVASSAIAHATVYGTGTCVPGSRGRIASAQISGHRFNANGTDREFGLFPPPQQPGADLRFLFSHELGHALGLAHSTDAVLLNNMGATYTATDKLVMYPSISPNHRHWTKYEKDSLRTLYGTRLGTLQVLQSGPRAPYNNGSAWHVPRNAPNPPANVVSGPGRISEMAPMRAFYAWADGFAPQVKGHGRVSQGGGIDRFPMATPSETAFMAPAMAYGFSDYRAYWIERDPDVLGMFGGIVTPYGPGMEKKKIYWMSSPDGVAWTQRGYLSDPTTGAPITIWTDSVSVAYNPSRAAFVVLWLDNGYNARYMTMPASGVGGASRYGVISGFTFWETPSMSCSGVGNANDCMIVGMGRDEPVSLTTLTGAFSSTGTWTYNSSEINSNMPQTHAPSVAYQPWVNKYVIAYLGRPANNIYSTARTVGGPWVPPAAPTATYPSDSLSPPQVGNCPAACGLCGSHAVLMTARYGP